MLIRDLGAEILDKFDMIQEINTNIRILINDGMITLMGTVSSFFEMRLVEKAIANVSGIKNIINTIKIVNDLKFRLSDISVSIFESSAI